MTGATGATGPAGSGASLTVCPVGYAYLSDGGGGSSCTAYIDGGFITGTGLPDAGYYNQTLVSSGDGGTLYQTQPFITTTLPRFASSDDDEFDWAARPPTITKSATVTSSATYGTGTVSGSVFTLGSGTPWTVNQFIGDLFLDRSSNPFVVQSNTSSTITVAGTPASGSNATSSVITPGSIGAWSVFFIDTSFTKPGLTTTVGIDVGNSAAWAQSTAYVLNQWVTANGNLYECTTAGTSLGSGTGPSGTGPTVSDNTVTWTYASAAGVMQPGIDPTLGVSNADVWHYDFTSRPGVIRIAMSTRASLLRIAMTKLVTYTPALNQFYSVGAMPQFSTSVGGTSASGELVYGLSHTPVGTTDIYLLFPTNAASQASMGSDSASVSANNSSTWAFSGANNGVTNWGLLHYGGSGAGQAWSPMSSTLLGNWSPWAAITTGAVFSSSDTNEWLFLQLWGPTSNLGTPNSGSLIYDVDFMRRSVFPQP